MDTYEIIPAFVPHPGLAMGCEYAGKGEFCLVAYTPLVDPDLGCSVDFERLAGFESKGSSSRIC